MQLAVLCCLLGIFSSSLAAQDTFSGRIESVNFENLHRFTTTIYRCEQPTELGMLELEQMGVKTVLNLRNRFDDKNEAKGTSLVLLHWPINTWKMSYADVLAVLSLINKAEKPVAVHCLHGADRTGVVLAAYRMAVDNWTKDEALQEFKADQFGYHQGWFPRLLTLLESIEIEELKKDFTSLKNKE